MLLARVARPLTHQLSSVARLGHNYAHNSFKIGLRSSSASFSTSPICKEIAFVFDIDGVLLRGNKAIPQAHAALELLNFHSIPYVFMTNGGGVTESSRIDFLSQELKIPLSPLQIVQAHTPMKALAQQHSFDRVLVVGGNGDNARTCALEYGFQDVVMPIDLVAQNPSISPHHRYSPEELAKWGKPVDLSKPVQAVLVFNDPRDMSTDLQIVMDLLNSEGGVVGTRRSHKVKSAEPGVPIIFSNNDFLWANDYSLPRFGQGAFRISVESLYLEANKTHLRSTIMGKPYKIQYDFTHHVLIDWRNKLLSGDLTGTQVLPKLGEPPKNSPFSKIYMVGDNPESDIKGAVNNGWESFLVRTGVYRDEDWGDIVAKPSVGVFDNVLEGVKEVLKR